MSMCMWALGYDFNFLTVVHEQNNWMNGIVPDQYLHFTDTEAKT